MVMVSAYPCFGVWYCMMQEEAVPFPSLELSCTYKSTAEYMCSVATLVVTGTKYPWPL